MGKTIAQRKREQLSVFDRHKLTIAFKTLAMPDELVASLSGPTKEEARITIKQLTGREV